MRSRTRGSARMFSNHPATWFAVIKAALGRSMTM
jgi:hypothetical protein